MTTSVEKECGVLEFQTWSQNAADMPGYVTKGWKQDVAGQSEGKGWVTFQTANQAMMFKLSA